MSLDGLRTGGKRALAAALSRIEADADEPEVADLLDAAFAAPKGVSLGLTGPPGVGKSTLIDALIRALRAEDRTVAVIAVDPSSTRSGGALLGDRTRLTVDPGDAGVFVRSMAARDRLGGVAEMTFPAMVLMRALYDVVIVETVGVGQSETAISEITDLTAFCAQPGSGDALQYMKAGVIEIPDLVVVTKLDLGAIAERTIADLKGALSLTGAGGDAVPVLGCAAATGAGVAALGDALSRMIDANSHRFAESRRAQAIRWSERQLAERFGTHGLSLARGVRPQIADSFSFRENLHLIKQLTTAISEAFQ